MVAMSVIEAEMEGMQLIIKKATGHEKEYFTDKLGNMEFQKNTIESNVQIGIITEAKYLSNVKNYLKDQEALYAQITKKMGAKNKHCLRVLKRIELLKIEIDGMENPQEEEVEVQPQ